MHSYGNTKNHLEVEVTYVHVAREWTSLDECGSGMSVQAGWEW